MGRFQKARCDNKEIFEVRECKEENDSWISVIAMAGFRIKNFVFRLYIHTARFYFTLILFT